MHRGYFRRNLSVTLRKTELGLTIMILGILSTAYFFFGRETGKGRPRPSGIREYTLSDSLDGATVGSGKYESILVARLRFAKCKTYMFGFSDAVELARKSEETCIVSFESNNFPIEIEGSTLHCTEAMLRLLLPSHIDHRSLSKRMRCYLATIVLGAEQILLHPSPDDRKIYQNWQYVMNASVDPLASSFDGPFHIFPNYRNNVLDIDSLNSYLKLNKNSLHDVTKPENISLVGEWPRSKFAGKFFTCKACSSRFESKEFEERSESILINRNVMVKGAQVVLLKKNMFWALFLYDCLSHENASQAIQQLAWELGLQFSLQCLGSIDSPRRCESGDDTDVLGDFGSNLENSVQGLAESQLLILSQSGILESTYDLHVWFDSLEMIRYDLPNIPPNIAIVTRSFAGDIERMNAYLIPSLKMFVDPKDTEIIIILDELEKDFTIGACLQSEYDIKVFYEPWPKNHSDFLRGIAFGGRYASPGYDRQQWSTFFLEQYTSANIISIIDSDAMLFGYLTEAALMRSGKIILRAAHGGDHYRMDKIALNLSETPYDFMWIDRMPLVFRRETLINVRIYISSLWGMSFNEAFKNISAGPFSQFNIISYYSYIFEHAFYDLITHKDSRGFISIGDNRGNANFLHQSCCNHYFVGCSSMHAHGDLAYMLRYNNYNVSWINNVTIANAFLEHVRDVLSSKHESVVWGHTDACQKFVTGRWTPFCQVK